MTVSKCQCSISRYSEAIEAKVISSSRELQQIIIPLIKLTMQRYFA
ncbi:hypothetical protein [Psychromonas arctica]|nr:hypothetical protein [Psychromonas arctica]